MSTLEMNEVIRQRRAERGMPQGDLAAKVRVDRRQIRRYELGETQPTLFVAKTIARALGITIDELAGDETHRVDLTGDWQSWKDGAEVINPHEVRMTQRGDTVEIVAVTRGTPLEEGGYMWRGERRVWDNEILDSARLVLAESLAAAKKIDSAGIVRAIDDLLAGLPAEENEDNDHPARRWQYRRRRSRHKGTCRAGHKVGPYAHRWPSATARVGWTGATR